MQWKSGKPTEVGWYVSSFSTSALQKNGLNIPELLAEPWFPPVTVLFWDGEIFFYVTNGSLEKYPWECNTQALFFGPLPKPEGE